MEELIQFELSKDFLERFKDAIDKQDQVFIRSTLESVKPADIASLLYEIDSEDSKFVIGILDTESAAEVVNDLDPDFRERFLKNFSAEEIADFVNHLDSDDAVDILNEIPVKKREEVIANLESEEQAAYILDLLRYEEDCAGGLMAKELIKANVNWTVVQCIDEIRRQAENISKIYSVYVVDNQQKLLGRVSLKRIILSDDNTKIADIYDDDIHAVETYMHEEEVAEIMRKYDLEAVPVVNVQGKLVGRITIDDIIDVITNMAEEERQLMSGISENVEEDDTVWVLSRARLPWLIIGMVGGMLGAQFIGLFEGEIVLIPALAFFIPLITATGGNVGIQSSSIVLQSLANRSVFEDSISKRLFKVAAVALLNGVVLAIFVFSVTIFIWDTRKLSLVVAIALFCVVLLASIMGTITPLILDKFKINPALASGPFITTANDLLGLGVYFTVAHLLYNL
ncbi:MAG: magnesium transporter [Bacteroidota bacterium]|nr:magnesium transporter [Bacteroidota bacterium]